MLVIGLTGGIGCGKSVVRHLFSNLGIATCNADDLARELVQPGTPEYHEIINYFGAEICLTDGQLNRALLKQRIFSSSSDKAWLEKLLHPRIRQLMHDFVQAATSPYVILEIPLLLETGHNPLITRILVVDCSEQQQIDRVQARDHLSLQEIKQIMAQQVSRSERLVRADDIIQNDGDETHLRHNVCKLHQRYLELCK